MAGGEYSIVILVGAYGAKQPFARLTTTADDTDLRELPAVITEVIEQHEYEGEEVDSED